MTSYKIIRTITNNIIRAKDINDHEVILIGKGIGFGKKANDIISSNCVERMFILANQDDKTHYDDLIRTTSPRLIEISNDVIDFIQSRIKTPLNEHIHIALTDHIAFLVRRCKMGTPVDNPFSLETANLYPEETQIAKEVVSYISSKLNISIPEGEIGFITLHIISASHQTTFVLMQKISQLVFKLTNFIEDSLKTKIDKNSLNYARLVTHLRFAIERIHRNEPIETPPEFEEIFKYKYPECYDLAYKLIKIMQNDLKLKADSSEIIYLAMHIYRFNNEADETLV